LTSLPCFATLRPRFRYLGLNSFHGTVVVNVTKELELSDDYLDGIVSIAAYLGPPWTPRKVRYARETGALPIRMKRGIGLYAFRSELAEALRSPDSLPAKTA